MDIFESYWSRFLAKDKKTFDGIAFEDLVEDLLTLMYGKKWNRTPKSHDGSRDFYVCLNDEILWAECKNYRDVLSLKILAPTLVMAQVCDANTILFFSRSEINSKAKEKITLYGASTSKAILFYDGKTLEKIIIEYNDQLSPNNQIPSHLLKDVLIEEGSVSVSEFFFPSPLSKMIATEKDFADYRKVSVLHYNEPFSLMITLCNNGTESCNTEICFAEDNVDRNYYEYLNRYISYNSRRIKSFILKPGESVAFSLSLRVTKFKKNLFLPNFQVNYQYSNHKASKWMSEFIKVECKWIGQTKLLGSHYNKIIQKVEDTLTNNNEFSLMLLIGKSGTGKSRILNECCCPLLKNGYKILELVVTQNHSVNSLIKEIIYFLWEIPAELIEQVIKERIDGKIYEDIDVDMNSIMHIAEMLKSLDNNWDEFMCLYKELLFEKMSKKKIAIIVDNMQFASDYFQQFWQCYVAFSVNQCRPNQTIFIASVNVDYMTEECSKTVYIMQNSNIRNLVNETINGFNDLEQGELFLRELMHIDNGSYDLLFKEIINSVSLNPFNLYQMVKLLEEDEIIKPQHNNQGYLLPTEAVWKTTWRIPKGIDHVLQRRFSFVINHMNEVAFYLILSACYLMEVVDEFLVNIFEINSTDLYYLEQHQIIKRTDNGYAFIHDIIRKYFEKNWPSKRLYCLWKIKSLDQVSTYSGIYKLYKLCILKDDTYIIKLCKRRDLFDIPVRLQSVFLENLFEQCINCTTLMKDLQKWLGAMDWICNCVRNIIGSDKSLEYHDKVYAYIENKFDDFSILCCNELRHLLHSHCDIYIQTHQRENAVNFARRIIFNLPQEPVKSDELIAATFAEAYDEYYVLKAIMYNRIFCAYNNTFPTDAITLQRNDAIKNSRELILSIKDKGKRNLVEYLNNSDDGYRYYGFQTEHKKLIEAWEKCLTDIPNFAPEKTMNYYRKQVQIHLINQDEEQVKRYIAEGRNYLEHGKYSHEPLIFNTFFTMAEIMNNLQHRPQKMYLNTEKLIDHLVKMQLLLKSDKMGDIYLLQGINAFYVDDTKTVYYALKCAYQDYNEKETSYYWIKRELIKENIITAYAVSKIVQKGYDVSFLPNEYQKQISCFSKTHYQAKGIIRTKDTLFNLPLVV